MTLMTINEVAEQARLHPLTIRRLINENRGPVPTRIGGRIFVRRDSFQTWLDSCTGFNLPERQPDQAAAA